VKILFDVKEMSTAHMCSFTTQVWEKAIDTITLYRFSTEENFIKNKNIE